MRVQRNATGSPHPVAQSAGVRQGNLEAFARMSSQAGVDPEERGHAPLAPGLTQTGGGEAS